MPYPQKPGSVAVLEDMCRRLRHSGIKCETCCFWKLRGRESVGHCEVMEGSYAGHAEDDVCSWWWPKEDDDQ